MDLMRNWVDIEVEMVSVCVICAVRTKCGSLFVELPSLLRALCIIFRAFKKDFREKSLSTLKAAMLQGKGVAAHS